MKKIFLAITLVLILIAPQAALSNQTYLASWQKVFENVTGTYAVMPDTIRAWKNSSIAYFSVRSRQDFTDQSRQNLLFRNFDYKLKEKLEKAAYGITEIELCPDNKQFRITKETIYSQTHEIIVELVNPDKFQWHRYWENSALDAIERYVISYQADKDRELARTRPWQR